MGKWGGGQRWPGQCKNVNENKFAAKKKLTKHKTNFWAHAKVAGWDGPVLVYPAHMVWYGGNMGLSLHIFQRARTHNQSEG